MTVRYAVTFEYDLKPPTTHQGTVSASNVGTCMARAVKAAQKALRPKSWSSAVCVLLERIDAETAPEAVQVPAGVVSGPDRAVA